MHVKKPFKTSTCFAAPRKRRRAGGNWLKTWKG